MPVKRSHWLLRIHRYLGLLCSVLFLIWFLSGMVMMYVRYPVLTREERVRHAPLLRTAAVTTPPPSADAVLGMLLGRPVYRSNKGVVYADDNTVMPGITSAQARQTAIDYFAARYTIRDMRWITTQDQWLNKGSFTAYLPAWVIQLNDPAHTSLYVSAATGEVFQDVSRREKILSWLGPIPHWIYLRVLIIKPHRYIWTQVVIWTSLLGCIMCLSGIAAGLIRWKRKRISPYKKPWLRWHHYTGLLFGLFTFTWILSGLFSMDPLHMGSRRAAAPASSQPAAAAAWLPALQLLHQQPVKEIHFTVVGQHPYLIAGTEAQRPLVISALSGQQVAGVDATLLDSAILQTVAAPLQERTLLTHYDAYYRARDSSRPLPVIRYRFADQGATCVYADPLTGAVLSRQDNSTRRLRWLYNGLHSFDFPWFHHQRPLWDITLLILLLGGAALSVTGVVLSFRWLRHKGAKTKLMSRNRG
ncbi:hypothetical protein ECE50_028020 [Chitinophaga sp. Mgbs1]|uniref:Uncharacterized protein n=1 Tax=Chitinophaga solisilvae TaxID=1233460 RepID=A0A3S1D197_9BACT|nr:hypothetical protein [Chitinophaga solisilvae]